MIIELNSEDVLRASRKILGLPERDVVLVDDAFLAASLRRAAGIFCPCSMSTLKVAILESLQYLTKDADDLPERIETAMEALVVLGDILELSQVTIDDASAKGTWVFAAPPAFVARPSGSVFLIGISPDEPIPLPTSLSVRVEHEGFARIIRPRNSENLPSILRDFGLVEFSEGAWLRVPKCEHAASFYSRMYQKLACQHPSGVISDLLIIDPERPVDYYRGRWVNPKHETGNFVARRPQAYGAPLWGYVALENGAATKFLDFPLKGNRWRGCDAAWHLQMAIDSQRGAPQVYQCRTEPGGAYLDFFSPIPLWAQRRLSILGIPAPGERCLFSYWIPDDEFPPMEEFLHNYLWLSRREAQH